MIKRITSALVAAGLFVTPALAGPSSQHFAQAGHHSGQAVSEASAGVVTGVATAVSIPIIAVGSTIAISGAGLQALGTDVLLVGDELFHTGMDEPALGQNLAPNGPPSLD